MGMGVWVGVRVGSGLLPGRLPIGGGGCGGRSGRSGFFRETLSVSIEPLRRTPYLLLLLAFALVSEKSPDLPDPPWNYWRFRLISARTQPGPQPGPPPFRHPLWARDTAPPPCDMGQQRPSAYKNLSAAPVRRTDPPPDARAAPAVDGFPHSLRCAGSLTHPPTLRKRLPLARPGR